MMDDRSDLGYTGRKFGAGTKMATMTKTARKSAAADDRDEGKAGSDLSMAASLPRPCSGAVTAA